jgi:hypothetical protein
LNRDEQNDHRNEQHQREFHHRLATKGGASASWHITNELWSLRVGVWPHK